MASRFEIVKFMNDINDNPLRDVVGGFSLISCFGNVHCHIDENPSLLPNPKTLLKSIRHIDRMRERGMVDYLDVFCDDVTEEYVQLVHKTEPGQYYMKPFDIQDAQDVVEFIIKSSEKVRTLVVHCDAGVSRSGAIGTYACELLGIDKATLPPWIDPNQHILKLLNDYKYSHG